MRTLWSVIKKLDAEIRGWIVIDLIVWSAFTAGVLAICHYHK